MSPAPINAARAHVRQEKKREDDSFGPAISTDTMPPGNPPTDFSKTQLPPYLTEGPAWENDKVAFRLYFDTRNNKDIFGKCVPGMVMDTVGANPNTSYHELGNWGMDIFRVGNSLGAGAIAFAVKNKQGKDTLIRLGGSQVKRERYEVIADGPVRAIFKVKYEFDLNGNVVTVCEQTSIWGGQYFYETQLSVEGLPSGSKVATGFADFYPNVSGQIEATGAKSLYSWGAQSENKDNLGLAVIIDKNAYDTFARVGNATGDIQNSYVIYQRWEQNKPNVYRFYAAWEKTDSLFAREKEFKEFLTNQVILFEQHLRYE